jgi:NAD(P)-dependent dehydrogenase (short-subunit alcohol dehydrogenase family)
MSIAQLDVTSPDSIAACKKEVEKMTDGRIDILVNNA